MNPINDLDTGHITTVCTSVTARPTTVRAAGNDLTLLFGAERQRDLAHEALTRTGYAATVEPAAASHPHGLRVTGWSSEALIDRVNALRRVADGLDRDLEKTAVRALDAFADSPPYLGIEDRKYTIATVTTEALTGGIRDRLGPLVRPDRLPADRETAEHVRNVRRLTDRVNALVGDHFNVACAAIDAYDHARRHHPEPAARRQAIDAARAFIHDRLDPDAFIDALAWAARRHPTEAATFARDYARTHGGTAREDRPAPDEAFPTWRGTESSAVRIAAADFPEAPTAGRPMAPGPASDAPNAEPRRPGRAPGGSR